MKLVLMLILVSACSTLSEEKSNDQSLASKAILQLGADFVVHGAKDESIDESKVNLVVGKLDRVDIYNHANERWLSFSNASDLVNESTVQEAKRMSNCSNVVKINFEFSGCTPYAIAKRNGIEICKLDSDGDCPGGHYVCLGYKQILKISKEGCNPNREEINLPDKVNPIQIERKSILLDCQ